MHGIIAAGLQYTAGLEEMHCVNQQRKADMNTPNISRNGLAGSPGSDTTRDVSLSETPSLIAASKVNGTNVYNRAGDSIGSIYDVMLDKRTGRVDYAIMSFGGFLGMGEHYHPLPWNALRFDDRQNGYVVDIDIDRLKEGPSFATSATPDWSDGLYGRRVDDYYGVTPATARR